MLLGYARPDARHSEAAQVKALIGFGVSEKKIWIESKRQRGDEYPIRDAMVASIRKKAQDQVIVSDFHRLASTGADLKAAVRSIRKAGAIIIEARTGRRSDCHEDLVDMTIEATEVYAGRGLSKQAASEIGKLGAAASPVTKERTGHMPLHDMKAIMDDHSLTIQEAIAKIRRDRRYKFRPSQATILRWAKSGKLKLLPRMAGRRTK